jgi:hypothetical protein
MILAVRWTGENLSEIQQHVQATEVTVRPDGENLYLEWAGWSMIALPEEFIIVDDEVLEVFVSSEEDMKNSFSVEWIE